MRNRANRPACLAAVLLCALPLAAAAPEGLHVESWRVDDATEVALVEDHRAPLVSLRLVFPAGDWSPWFDGEDGDDAFAIQIYDPGGELRRRADDLGANVALGNGDRTSVLSAACLKEDLPKLLELVKDILANRSFDKKELRRWAQNEKLEWKASQKDPGFRGAQAIAQALYREGDPRRMDYEAAESVGQDVKHLAEVRDQIVRLPGRIVAFAGDLTRADAARAASGLLPAASPDVPSGLKPELAPVVPAEARPREKTVRLPRLTQVYLSLARDMIPLTDPDYPAYIVANHILGGHFYSRLYRALRHEGGDTYGAGSGGPGEVVPLDYSLYTFTRAANQGETETKFLNTLMVFQERGVTEPERADAVSFLIGHRPFDRETPSQVLSRWLRERALGLDPGTLDALVDRAAALTIDDVNRFIGRFHNPAKFTLVRVIPE